MSTSLPVGRWRDRWDNWAARIDVCDVFFRTIGRTDAPEFGNFDMSLLAEQISRLFQWLESIGLRPPSADVRIVEVHSNAPNLDDRGRSRVQRDALHEVPEYEARFAELMRLGLPWINMSCYGIFDGFLIVAIEFREVAAPIERPTWFSTPVNLSGAPRLVLQNGWDAAEIVVVD